MREFASSLLVSKFMDDSLYSAKHVHLDDAKHCLGEHCGFHDIICPKENQAAPKVTFGFLGILTSKQPAKQAVEHRRCGFAS